MGQYSSEEQDEIIRDYFGPPGSEEVPRCPHCGELLNFDTHYSPSRDFHVHTSCKKCQITFHWKQPQQIHPWKPIHINYFLERYQTDQSIRCPIDDCYITYSEFSDSVVEFRCPYCNHRGKAQVP